ncbi:RecQ family ATP-dependent DNA helicase [Herpetosiphon llansteffanensis]|uniref:RecQ family ATP-dependent DNA helicase n=1 Tax=Herpetosiphon llansteffanensis TaxID=2094568 RepID=UPI00196A8437|nr:RecQ family ATP-dependent DNA helicase [Herpetosiphon llansteffanensis]
MQITAELSYDQALEQLRRSLNNPRANFRDGQWSAIDRLINEQQQLLVVQRTGWGKSWVYFIAAQHIRLQRGKMTLIISPLLALINNQIAAAQRFGLTAVSINASNTDDWAVIKARVLQNQVDVLLIAPERFANEAFMEEVLLPISQQIGLLVIDEAHCISDWGHDFRPDYRRIIQTLQVMPKNLPILATTATANQRVIDDIRQHLGTFAVERGPLMRESLHLQTVRLADAASRLAWLAHYIPQLPGTGIIYTLTHADTEQVATWLNQQAISACAYHAGLNAETRTEIEQRLSQNQIKVLVATSALGMGYDKPDLGFVIHYQAPSSIIAYYQQVGRTGRAIEQAYGILLAGEEDAAIHDYFRREAFPSQTIIEAVLHEINRHDGVKLNAILEKINARRAKLEHALKFLSVEAKPPVIYNQKKWYATINASNYQLDHAKIAGLNQRRSQEWQAIQAYVDTPNCLMRYLAEALDDLHSSDCGRCANCRGSVFDNQPTATLINQAARFLRHSEQVLEPRKIAAPNIPRAYRQLASLAEPVRAEPGRVLARWGHAGWGAMVSHDKKRGHFRDDLVAALVEMIQQRWQPQPCPTWVASIPSTRNPHLVEDFARRVAQKLGIPWLAAVVKIRNNEPQKSQHNAFHQQMNVLKAFKIAEWQAEPVLLIDDIVDSRWTLTIVAKLLKEAGATAVYPCALASTASDDDE